jgi:RNA polymerase sigma-70 factor (ECF subfamily)
MKTQRNCAQVPAAHSQTDECEPMLVAAAKRGDHQAYAELCRRHSRQIFRTVLRITRNTEDAEDAVQESFMKAFVHLYSFNGRAAFSSWLTRIAINCALMELRRRQKYPESLLDIFNNAGNEVHRDFVESSPTPEDLCVEAELARMVRHALNGLRPSLRQAMLVRYSQDASLEQIATLLGITRAATKARLFRGRAALRLRLGSTQTGKFRMS